MDGVSASGSSTVSGQCETMIVVLRGKDGTEIEDSDGEMIGVVVSRGVNARGPGVSAAGSCGDVHGSGRVGVEGRVLN